MVYESSDALNQELMVNTGCLNEKHRDVGSQDVMFVSRWFYSHIYATIMFSSVKSDIGVNKTEDNAFRQIIIPSLTLTDEGFNDDGV